VRALARKKKKILKGCKRVQKSSVGGERLLDQAIFREGDRRRGGGRLFSIQKKALGRNRSVNVLVITSNLWQRREQRGGGDPSKLV